MRNFLFLFLLVFVTGIGFSNKLHAQIISNISVSQLDKSIEVNYDLEGTSTYKISLYYSDSSGKNWIGPLKAVSGDVGPSQRPGKQKKIIWDASSELSSVEGYFQFKIVAEAEFDNLFKENPQQPAIIEPPVEKPKKVLTDLERRKLTLVMEKAKKRRTPWLVSFVITGAAGAFGYYQTGALYEQYKTATTNAASLRQTITTLGYAYPAALGVAGISFIEFLVKSGKYSNAKKALVNTTINIGPTKLGIAYRF
jgi:hypothetical protein